MIHELDPSEGILNRRLSRIAGLIVAVFGAMALLGWALDAPILKSLHPSWVSMKANTAAAFLLAGISLFLKADFGKRSRIADICAGIVALIGLLTLCEYVLGINLRIDQLLFREPSGAVMTGTPGRMAPDTAAAFLLAGLGLLCLDVKLRKVRPAGFLLFIAGLISLRAIFGYIVGTAFLYGYSRFTVMALHTALAFVALSGGGLISRRKKEIPAASGSSDIPNKTDRRMTCVSTIVFALMMAFIVIAGGIYCRKYEKNYREELGRRLGAITALKEIELAQYRKERLGDAAIIYRNAPFSQLVRRFLEKPEDADAHRQLQVWMDKYIEHYQYDQVTLVDTHGVTRLSAPASLLHTTSAVSKRIPEILRSGQADFQDFYIDENDKCACLAVLVPILDESAGSRPLGIIVLRIDPQAFIYPYIQNWPIPSRTGETLLVRREGNDVLFLNELKFGKNAALNLRIPIAQKEVPAVKAALGETGIDTGSDYRGEPVIADIRAVGGTPWFLVAKIDLSEAYAPLRSHLRLAVDFIVVLLLCLIFCVGFVWRMGETRLLRERLSAEAALRETTARLDMAQRAAGAGMWDWDIETGRLEWSERMFELLGLDPLKSAASFETWKIAIHPEDIEIAESRIQKALEDKTTLNSDYRILLPGGQTRWINATGEGKYNSEGKQVRMIGICTDITKRKMADMELKRSNVRFQLLSETAARLLESENPQVIVEKLCLAVMNHLDCQVFFNFLADEKTGRLQLNACAGIDEEEARRVEWLDYGVAVCGTVARDGARIVAENIADTPDPRTELVCSYGVQAYCCHPLMAHGRVIGTLSFGTKTRAQFSPEDVFMMEIVADQVAIAMQRILDQEELRKSHDEMGNRVRERTAELSTANEQLSLEIVERRKAEESVSAERRRLFDVLEMLPVYVLLLAPDYHVPFENRFFRERFCESNGQRCFEYLFNRTEPCENCETFSVLKTGAPHEWEWTSPDGGIFQVFDFPFIDSDGSTLVMEMGIEITARKHAENALKKREKQLEMLSRKVISSQEEERASISRNLHDELGQRLSALGMEINCLEAQEEINRENISNLGEAIADINVELHRIYKGLRPAALDKLGLEAAIQAMIREYKDRFGLRIHANIEGTVCKTDSERAIIIYRILQEALTNVAKHSGAKEVRISLGRDKNHIVLDIADDGTGFNPEEASGKGGMGLLGMRERAAIIDGKIEIDTEQGKGTRILMRIASGNGGRT